MSSYRQFGILKRVYWRLLRACGFQQLSWDKQYEAGVWCRNPSNQDTIDYVTNLCQGGRLIEFGCGEGTLLVSLPRNSFSDYFGYDISSVATNRAQERARQAGLERVAFESCDMAAWRGSSDVSLVLVEECLMYLTIPDAERFLKCCCESLSPNGKILVIVYSAAKCPQTLETCRRICKVENETVIRGRTFLTLSRK